MSQTSERAEPSERAEQIWSGWSKFGVGGTNLEWVEQIWSEWSGCGQNKFGEQIWRRRCCVSFYFRGLNF